MCNLIMLEKRLDRFNAFTNFLTANQKQPSRGILRKRCSENIQQIYRRTLLPKCDFTLEITLRHECSPVKFVEIFRTYFAKNTSKVLLLANNSKRKEKK